VGYTQPEWAECSSQRRGVLATEAGSALAFVVVTVAVLAVVVVGLARYAGAIVTRAQARTAADASALAGASSGTGGARLLAERNGATLLLFSDTGGQVRVTVLYGGVTMAATAALVPV
jgi:hypothetical protein